jgi:glycosyltransferase involved in cell wall biosynthesis
VIKNLRGKLKNHQVFLYLRKNQKIDFELPENWQIKIVNFYYLWTQIGLSLEMLLHSIDTLFVPAHILPLILPKRTIVTIHGLEYEFFPEAYSFWERLYMRFFIKRSVKKAQEIIAVSQNTKKDLKDLYKAPEEKITVIYEGIANNYQSLISNSQTTFSNKIFNLKPYLLFIGRIEERKNIQGIIEAFSVLKEKKVFLGKLVLAGKPGYGYEKIQFTIQQTKFKNDILETGYIEEIDKYKLLKGAEIFLFPSFYEGFGLPILEAQVEKVPVVTSNISSMPEVAGDGAILVNPRNTNDIIRSIKNLISNDFLRNDIIKKGYENTKKFSWEKCAREIVEIINKKSP